MCGIFAVVHRGRRVSYSLLYAAISSMSHRGPDAEGIVIREAKENDTLFSVGLAHRRLAIIDLDRRSDQPFLKNGAATIFNGEIYNFRELKSRFARKTNFSTTSDTEVLHEALRLEGIDSLRKFNGQWAFVQHVDGESRLSLGRDVFGKKPLFIHQSQDTFIISSTIRAIATYLERPLHFDRNFLQTFFFHMLTPVGENGSGFEDISQLSPGHGAIFDFSSWSLAATSIFSRLESSVIPPSEVPLKDVIRESVLRRLISDRPVGLLLSGGVDSTLILSVLKAAGRLDEITCFVGETGISEDAQYGLNAARLVGVEPRVVRINYDFESFNNFLDICSHQERPFRLLGNLMAIPQLYRAIADTEIKVVLDGTGADEMFGGYWDRYLPFALREAFSKRRFAWLMHMIFASHADVRRFLFSLKIARGGSLDFVDPEIASLADQMLGVSNSDDPLAAVNVPFSEALVADIFEGRLQDWLWQNDRNSMSYSIEARSPFMDRNLFPYVYSGYEKKFVGKYNKFELRQVFEAFHVLPTQWRIQKQGFRWSASKFIAQNFNAITDLCAGSPILSEMFPEMVARLKSGNQTADEVVEKMVCIAGVEHSLDAR